MPNVNPEVNPNSKNHPWASKFSGFQGLKGLISSASTLVYTPMYRLLLVAVKGTRHLMAMTAGYVLGVQLECGPKWMVGRCPHSLHNPSLRLSLNIDCRLHDSVAPRSHRLLGKRNASNGQNMNTHLSRMLLKSCSR